MAGLVAVVVGGCVIPQDFDVIFDGQEYAAKCECVICEEREADGTCVDFLEPPAEVQLNDCSVVPGQLDAVFIAELLAKLNARCDDFEAPLAVVFGPQNVACQLDPDFNPAEIGDRRLFAPVDETDAMLECEDPIRERQLPQPSFDSQIATFNSSVVISDPDFSALVNNLSGTVEFSGGNCSTGTCPITIHRLVLRSPGFDAIRGSDTISISDAAITSLTRATGRCISLAPSFPEACGFLLDRNSLVMFASGIDPDGDRRGFEVRNDMEGGGIINHAEREIRVTQVVIAGDTSFDFDLTGAVANFSPRVDLPPNFTTSCGLGVKLDVEIEDVDGDIADLSIAWYVDGRLVARDTTTPPLDLEPGTHSISAIATDADGGVGFDSVDVEVTADTTPPQIVGQPVDLCLWPPNHKRVVLTAADVGVIAIDDCDPNPRVVFVAGSSSQPDDGLGDGSTTSDLVVKPDSICARSERQGPVLDGRTYAIRLRAVDAAGNLSPITDASVRVPHDQRDARRCDVSAGLAVPEGDPRCMSDAQPTAERRTAGCRLSTGGEGGVLLLIFGLIWVRAGGRRWWQR